MSYKRSIRNRPVLTTIPPTWRNMRRPHHSCSRLCVYIALVLLLFTVILLGEYSITSAGDDPIPIGSITVNPQANNRRVVVLKGTAKELRALTGQDQYGFSACGQAFTLEDATGTIDVWYVIKCQADGNIVVVAEGDQMIVYAVIDVPPTTNMKTSPQLDSTVRAMATKLVRGKP